MRSVRRSAAFYALPLLIAAELFAIFSRGIDWAHEWGWAVDWANGATILLGPVLAGCVAADVAVWRREHVLVLTRSTPRGRHNLLRAVAADVLVGGLVHLLGVVVVAGICLAGGAPATPPLLGVVVALAMLAAAGGVGALVAGVPRSASIYAAPAAAVVVFACSYAASSGALPPVFRVGGVTGSVVGLRLDPRLLGGVALFLVSLVALSAAVLVLRDSVVARPAARAVVLLSVLLLIATTTGLHRHGGERFVVDHDVAYRCRGDEPSVCLAAATSLPLQWLPPLMHRGYVELRQAGASPPSVFRQALPGRRVPSSEGRMFLTSFGPERGRGDLERVSELLSVPRDCPQLTASSPPPERYFQVQRVLQLWIAQRLGALDESGVTDPGEAAWLAADREVQGGWVRATYPLLRSCELKALVMPDLPAFAGTAASP